MLKFLRLTAETETRAQSSAPQIGGIDRLENIEMATKKQAAFSPSAGFVAIGQNIFAKSEGGKLMIEIDMGADLGKSASGKSIKIASTGGNVSIGQGLKIGLNVYEPVATV